MSESYKDHSKNNAMKIEMQKFLVGNRQIKINAFVSGDTPVKDGEEIEAIPESKKSAPSDVKPKVDKKPKIKDESLSTAGKLAEIYGDKTPPKEVLEILKKLRGKSKIESYLDIISERVKEDASRKSHTKRTKKKKITRTPNKPQSTKKETKIIPEETGTRIAETLEEQNNIPTDTPFEPAGSAPTSPEKEIEAVQSADDTNIQEELKISELEPKISTENKPIEPGWIEYTPDVTKETSNEDTRAEGYAKLQKVIDYGKLHGIIDTAQKENVEGDELYKRLEKATADRSAELSSKIEKIGGVEKMFRTLGERYNKLGWKSKIAVGLSLGVGAGVAGSFGSLGIAAGLLSGVAVQRTAGMASMFLKFEKNSQNEKWGKEKAMGKAIGWTILMTAGAVELSSYISHTQWGEDVSQWFGNMLGHNSPQTITSDHSSAESIATQTHTPEMPPQTPVSPEIVAGTATVAPHVETSGGAGTFHSRGIYNNDVIMQNTPKFMQPEAPLSHMPGVPEMPPPPPMAPEIAVDTVAPVPTPIEMPTVNASTGHGYEYMVKRLWEDLHKPDVTLPSNIDPHSDLAKLLEANKDSIDGVVHNIASNPQHGFFNADGTSVRIDPSAHMTIGQNGQIHFGDATHPGSVIHSTPEMQAHTTPVYPQHTEAGTAHTEVGTAHIPNVEAGHTPVEGAQSPATVDHSFVTNSSGLEVQTHSPHIYADWQKHLLVYGGSPGEKSKLIAEYLSKHPNSYVYSAGDNNESRIPWHLLNGKAVPERPIHTSNFFGFKTLMKAPALDELRKFIQ